MEALSKRTRSYGVNGKYFPVVTPMTCYLVTSPFEDCSCHGSDVHDDDTSRIGGIFSGRAGRGGSGCVEQGRCTRFLHQMHGGRQVHEHIIGTSYFGRAAFE
jgi:hypothetical protein